MGEVVSQGIHDKDESGIVASVVHTDDPNKNAVVVGNPDGSNITESLALIEEAIQELCSRLAFLPSVRGVAADLRVTLLSGVVTTVSTVSNISSIGGFAANQLMQNQQNAIAVLSNINNVL